jgi:hypothetical protein
MTYPDLGVIGALSEALEESGSSSLVGPTMLGQRVIQHLLRNGYVIAGVGVPRAIAPAVAMIWRCERCDHDVIGLDECPQCGRRLVINSVSDRGISPVDNSVDNLSDQGGRVPNTTEASNGSWTS